jgi:hypothetical protein
VSDAAGEVSLGLSDASVGLGATDYTLGGSHGKVTAPAVRLDDYLAEHEPGRRVRLLKMDVEGLEPLVLAGMGDTLQRNAPDAVLLEYNATMFARHGQSGPVLLETLRAHGYDLYRPEAFGRVRPLGDGVVLDDAPVRESAADRSALDTIRAGLAGRRALFNVLAVRRGAEETGLR